jgi:hypothetical protein
VTVERETYEFRPVTVRDASNKAYLGSWHYQITALGGRPIGTWLTMVNHAGVNGFVIQNLATGVYLLWIRVDDDNPFLPVPKPVAFSVA